MSKKQYTVDLRLPAQAAAEPEATITKWMVKEGDTFKSGQILAEVESAKSNFEFEAPCNGKVRKLFFEENSTLSYEEPALQVETEDASMLDEAKLESSEKVDTSSVEQMEIPRALPDAKVGDHPISLLGIGGYLPSRVVSNKELLKEFPGVTDDYMYQVTGIRERRWIGDGEKPSDMALKAAQDAIRNSDLDVKDIGAIVVSTTTPDVIMPSTACILQDKLEIRGVPAFDLNAACSGWLYGITIAKGMIFSGIADNILVVAVDVQSKLLDKKDRVATFLFGDGAGATIVSGSGKGHLLKKEILLADSKGLEMAERKFPGYWIPNGNQEGVDPWVRLDGKALFKFATISFSAIVKQVIKKSKWEAKDVRWVIPHQANRRIIKAAANKCGLPFEKFYVNIEKVGNTSSASIPIALLDIQNGLQKGDKVVFCSVGAGITAAALSIEW